MLNSHPSEGETPSFKGSMLICTVEEEEEAWELIRNDIYVKSGVWDVDAAQVLPVCFFYAPYSVKLFIWLLTGLVACSSSLRLGLLPS